MTENSDSAKKLFGTDGIRGTANQYPMTPDIVVRVGQAIGYLIKTKKISFIPIFIRVYLLKK